MKRRAVADQVAASFDEAVKVEGGGI